MNGSDKSDDPKSNHGHEWTVLDDLYGEWIARDLDEKAQEEGEHFRRAHSRDPIDGILHSVFGTMEECINPRCDAERFSEENETQSESFWERWFRKSGNGNDGES